MSTPAAPASEAQTRPDVFAIFERYGLILIWAVIAVIFALIRPDVFLQWGTVSLILGSQTVLVVLALALMIPLVAGDFDLSVAANMTLGSMVFAIMMQWVGVTDPDMLRRVFRNSERIFSVHGVLRAFSPSGLSNASRSVSS